MMHPLRVYTIPALILGEVPTFIFTMIDLAHALPQYRENDRPYPSIADINKAGKIYLRNVLGILLLGALGMEFFIQTNTVPYNLNSDLSIYTAMIQFIESTLFTEFLFYWLHRYVHYNRALYRDIHYDHHRWRYNSFAIVNHDLAMREILVFSLCPAIPCIALGVHWKVMLLHSIYTNWQGTYSHSGYNIPLLNILLVTDSRDHDNHHKHPTYNFAGGGWYSIMDRVFGTYYPIE